MWQGKAADDFTSTPAVAGGLVFIASADHFLYAFPAAGCGAAVCAPAWKAHLLDAVVDSSVAVAGGVAYVGDFARPPVRVHGRRLRRGGLRAAVGRARPEDRTDRRTGGRQRLRLRDHLPRHAQPVQRPPAGLPRGGLREAELHAVLDGQASAAPPGTPPPRRSPRQPSTPPRERCSATGPTPTST